MRCSGWVEAYKQRAGVGRTLLLCLSCKHVGQHALYLDKNGLPCKLMCTCLCCKHN